MYGLPSGPFLNSKQGLIQIAGIIRELLTDTAVAAEAVTGSFDNLRSGGPAVSSPVREDGVDAEAGS